MRPFCLPPRNLHAPKCHISPLGPQAHIHSTLSSVPLHVFFFDEVVCHQSKGRDVKTSLVLACPSARPEGLCRSHHPSLAERSKSKGSCTHTELQVQVAQSKAHSDPVGSKGQHRVEVKIKVMGILILQYCQYVWYCVCFVC